MNDFKIAFEKLVCIMLELREKCPWDQKQTNESLRYLTMEECYELSDAILENNAEGIKEELGDLLLQVMLHAEIGYEEKEFNNDTAIGVAVKSLVSKYPNDQELGRHIRSLVNSFE